MTSAIPLIFSPLPNGNLKISAEETCLRPLGQLPLDLTPTRSNPHAIWRPGVRVAAPQTLYFAHHLPSCLKAH